MTSALSQSVREAVGGGAGACLNFGENVCVAHQDELFINICWAGGDAYDFPTICDVCVYIMSTVSVRNHPEIFIVSHRVVKLCSCS